MEEIVQNNLSILVFFNVFDLVFDSLSNIIVKIYKYYNYYIYFIEIFRKNKQRIIQYYKPNILNLKGVVFNDLLNLLYLIF